MWLRQANPASAGEVDRYAAALAVRRLDRTIVFDGLLLVEEAI